MALLLPRDGREVMMAKAIIYVRVSDSRQVENTSLDGQEKVCREWCRTNELEVSRVYVERGESAKSADRPEFQAMFRYLAQVAKGSTSHVVVYKFDRFSRNVKDGAVSQRLHPPGSRVARPRGQQKPGRLPDHLPPDVNTLLSVANHCLRVTGYINVIVSDKQKHLQYLTMDEAIAHCTKGVSIWRKASNDEGTNLMW